MKNLIQNSILIKRLGKGPNSITAFNIQDESQKSLSKYCDISKASGASVGIQYSYEEDGSNKYGSITLDIPSNLSETEVKDFVISEIESALNS